MFTWNFQYISKNRLAEDFTQLMLDPNCGDILIRIHTAIHLENEAVDLAKFIAAIVPKAHIFGTSTSAVINNGKLLQNQCLISVTQMSDCKVRTALLPTYTADNKPIPPEELCRSVKDAVIQDDTKLMLTFLTRRYLDVYSFVDKCNDVFPDVQMIGGISGSPDIKLLKSIRYGFVFNENGWTKSGIICASVSGKDLEALTSYATGAQEIGRDAVITDTFGPCILALDGRDAANEFFSSIGSDIKERPELAALFPLVYSDADDLPIIPTYLDDTSLNSAFNTISPVYADFYRERPELDANAVRDLVRVNHNVPKGKRIKRAFIYDRKVISDNHALFRRVENFEKAETIFAYSCTDRCMIYSNCAKWELSAYVNTNISGCITEGEIACVNGRNTFANCTFVVSVFGEKPSTQEYNPYAFSHTDTLVADNQELLSFLYDMEKEFAQNKQTAAADNLKSFVRDCELKLLYSENEDIPNAASMNMDIRLKGYDRVCMINVFDTSSMETVFPKRMINLTQKNYISNCVSYARKKNYPVYYISKWHVAVCAPSYMVSLSDFTRDMETLQKKLFEATSEYIAVVPMFCIIDDCTADNVNSVYYSAHLEMMQKNIQFYVRDANYGVLDEDSIRERYRMVNVINYALAHDKVIPYFQGIYDNNSSQIHHYESLMRLEDEDGNIYYPSSFLGVARSYGLLYDSLSLTMINKVFEKFQNIEDRSVSINMSMRDIHNREISERIFEFLSTAKHPENFVFEILENEDIYNYEELVAFVDKIHDLGALISIDDFGSGYSNLQHIASINSDYIKIDGSIIKNCCDDEQSANLISLISGWKAINQNNIKIIAEFVENEKIQNMMVDFDIDFSQGYLFSKPSPLIDEL